MAVKQRWKNDRSHNDAPHPPKKNPVEGFGGKMCWPSIWHQLCFGQPFEKEESFLLLPCLKE